MTNKLQILKSKALKNQEVKDAYNELTPEMVLNLPSDDATTFIDALNKDKPAKINILQKTKCNKNNQIE